MTDAPPALRASPPPPQQPPPVLPLRRPGVRFLRSHPAHLIALGFGSGLAPIAPGTVGTLWAWLSFALLHPVMNDARWALLLVVGTLIGWWACTVTARHMAVADPGAIVWDEVLAFWLVLWLISPTGHAASFWLQLLAFALFRYFDAAKPGPVAWADSLFKGQPGQPVSAPQGFGILLDDFVAAGCTLLVIALGVALRGLWQ